MPEPNDILKLLLQNEVEFVLVGGLAAVTYGVSTMTQDVDVCLSFDSKNIRRLLKALKEIHPKVRAGKGNVSLFDYSEERLSQLDNLYLKTDLGELDLLGKVGDIGSYEDVKKSRVR